MRFKQIVERDGSYERMSTKGGKRTLALCRGFPQICRRTCCAGRLMAVLGRKLPLASFELGRAGGFHNPLVSSWNTRDYGSSSNFDPTFSPSSCVGFDGTVRSSVGPRRLVSPRRPSLRKRDSGSRSLSVQGIEQERCARLLALVELGDAFAQRISEHGSGIQGRVAGPFADGCGCT